MWYALCAGKYSTNYCEYMKELTVFFASSYRNFLSYGKDGLVAQLRDGGTHFRCGTPCALASTQQITVSI